MTTNNKRTESAQSKGNTANKTKLPNPNLYPNSTTKNFRTTDEELGQLRNQYKLIRKFQIIF